MQCHFVSLLSLFFLFFYLSFIILFVNLFSLYFLMTFLLFAIYWNAVGFYVMRGSITFYCNCKKWRYFENHSCLSFQLFSLFSSSLLVLLSSLSLHVFWILLQSNTGGKCTAFLQYLFLVLLSKRRNREWWVQPRKKIQVKLLKPLFLSFKLVCFSTGPAVETRSCLFFEIKFAWQKNTRNTKTQKHNITKPFHFKRFQSVP